MNFSGADVTTTTGILTTVNTLGPWKGSRFANTRYQVPSSHATSVQRNQTNEETGQHQLRMLGFCIRNNQQSEETVFT